MHYIKILIIFTIAFGGFTWSLPSLAYSSTTSYLTTKNMNKRLGNTNSVTHKLSYTKEYKKWQNIKERCYTEHHKSYKYYGLRGIKLADYWLTDVVDFCNYLKSLPNYDKNNYSLDRIDNNGNYEKGNLRWADKREQMNNRTIKGVSKHNNIYPNNNNWIVRFFFKKTRINLGTYKTISEAILVRDNYLKTLKI